MIDMRDIELTVIMPCLNEAETIEICIRKAIKCMQDNGIEGEVLVADNGSTDGSQEIAINAGARVVSVLEKGYGSALIGGTKAAKGKYCIMGDADDSYDFSNLMPYIYKLREGYDLVMGNRYRGGIEKGAMPLSHKYLGTPVISFLGRLFYHNNIGDFNCGMRAYNREKILRLNLQTTGMEYASEMIVKAALYGLTIAEVPTTLNKDGRTRPPHLNTWRDGWRHLKFLLLHCPNWLFLYPGIGLTSVGFILLLVLMFNSVSLGTVNFDINTLFFGAIFILIGLNAILFSCFTSVYASNTQYIPMNRVNKKISKFSADKGVFIGAFVFILGLIAAIVTIVIWGKTSFGDLNPYHIMRITIPAGCFMVAGMEMMFGGFFIGILDIRVNSR